MRYTINVNPSEINFSPSTVLEEIYQNVTTIVTTVEETVPLFRIFGVNYTFLDDPIPLSKTRQIAEIIEKVELFEPRVIVEEVKFSENHMDGQLYPVVIISIKNGVKL